VNITMSTDGFIAGPAQSEKDPLGIGGMQLHQWLLPLKAFRETHEWKAVRSTRARASVKPAPRAEGGARGTASRRPEVRRRPK
jgi:hypothetical protein